GLTNLVGTTFPAIITGRAPSRGDELVIGKRSLHQLGRSLGDRVSVDTGEGPKTMTIVGTVAFPRLNHGSFSTLGLGEGALLPASAFPKYDLTSISDLPPDADLARADLVTANGDAYEFLTIRLKPHTTPADRPRVIAAPR